jgi:pSer/pThr/pTyr-binding forkhead associated (FHA) protein
MTRPPRPRTIAGTEPIPAGTSERRLDAGVINNDLNPLITGDKRYSLAIIDGPDAGTVFRVERARSIIGRSGADIPLNDSEASRNHAVLDVRGGIVLLEDLGSTNGTSMAGERLSGPVDLQNHTEFQIGSTTLMLIITEID